MASSSNGNAKRYSHQFRLQAAKLVEVGTALASLLIVVVVSNIECLVRRHGKVGISRHKFIFRAMGLIRFFEQTNPMWITHKGLPSQKINHRPLVPCPIMIGRRI